MAERATPGPTPAATASPVRGEAATAQASEPAALRLSEVLADPVEPGVDRDYEWVELVNTADVVVSTAGWSIGDASAVDRLPGVEVPPGGFVVVAAEAAVLPVNALIVRVPDGAIGNGLNNAGDAVRLLSPGGEVVDALSFGENRDVFDSPPPVAGAGATLGARAHEGVAGAERWAETLRPSPGGRNALPTVAATVTPAEAEPPVEAAAAPAPAPVATAPAERNVAAAPAPTLVPLPTRFEREPGGPAPWIALGAVTGVSAVLALAALRGMWRTGPGGWRRGG